MMTNESQRSISGGNMTGESRIEQSERVTVTLAPGQRGVLDAIAKQNGTTVSFVVRYAIARFVAENKDRQIKLRFPEEA